MISADVSSAGSTDGTPTYLGGGNPAGRFGDYYPAWVDNLADDVTIEGSLLDGAAQGAEAARTIVVTIRTLYDDQEFNFAGPCGDNGWIEDYTARVRGEPIGCVGLVTRNAAGQTQHIAANYRPRSSLLLLSRLVGEQLARTPYAKYFVTSESAGRTPVTAIRGETILTGARIMAIVPTTDIARAKAFYGGTLNLIDANLPTPGPQVVYRCGDGTLLEVYERATTGEAEHTLASWEVSDLRATVDQLRDRGVHFEEYDLPELKTVDGISTTGDLREAWCRYPDGNVLRVHSHVET